MCRSERGGPGGRNGPGWWGRRRKGGLGDRLGSWGGLALGLVELGGGGSVVGGDVGMLGIAERRR